jgi:phage-related protein
MATFTYTPDFGIAFEVRPTVRVSQFGDGYQQRQASGINTQPKNWDLKFSLRTDAEADAIEGFLVDRAGVESFDWSDINGVTGKYVCMGWQRTKDRYNLNTISTKFQQVFEP